MVATVILKDTRVEEKIDNFSLVYEEDGIKIYQCKHMFIESKGKIVRSKLFDKRRFRPVYVYFPDNIYASAGNSWGHDIKTYAKRLLPKIKEQYSTVQDSI